MWLRPKRRSPVSSKALFSSLEEVSRSENNLKNLIAVNRQADLWNVSIIPTDSVDLAPPEISLPEALKAAMDNRPELQQSTVAREINQIDQKYFREQTKPAIDLVGSYGWSVWREHRAAELIRSPVRRLELRDAVNRLLLNAGFDPLARCRPCKRFRPICLAVTTSRCKIS